MSQVSTIQSQQPQIDVTRKAQAIPQRLISQIDLLISLNLWSWPALTLAIQNAWGGSPQLSSEKREWFAGAVSELIMAEPPGITDVEDLEDVLLQVMLDEFEVVVDDGSAEETAKKIWKGLDKLSNGDTSELQEQYRKWQEKQAKGDDKLVGITRGEDDDGNETDWDEDNDEEEQWNGFPNESTDINMSDAPPSAEGPRLKSKIEPEIDDEGFTKVVGKKRR